MRAVVAMFKHETNTFSPVPTPAGRFGPRGPTFGSEVGARFSETQTALGGLLQACREEGIEVVTPVAAAAAPSGPVPVDVFEPIVDAICEAVAQGCDAVLLDLHGAMVTEHADDGEGLLLQRIRALAPDVPIGVALDFHGNLSEEMVASSTVMSGYKTYPHVDVRETGLRTGRLLLRALAGEIRPVMSWRRLPLLAHTLRMPTDEEPMRSLMAQARRLGAPILDASLFGGFPLADIPTAGMSVLVVADGNRAAADEAAEALAAEAWAARDDFVFEPEPLAQSIARAKALGGAGRGPVVLVDHSDNSASGGTQDRVEVLEEALRQGLTDMAVFAICDPAAVAAAVAAGPGERLRVELGGRIDLPAIGLKARSLTVDATVRTISDGEYVARGPMFKGVRYAMGRSCVLALDGGIDVVVCERHHEPWDLGCLLSLGIDPASRRYLLLKSRVHFRAAFAPLAQAIVNCDGAGVTSSNYDLFPFRRLKRPIFPLDPSASLIERPASAT